MKIVLWSILALFLIGDAFFVLPVNLTGDKLTTSYYTNYRKDSALLKNVFPDKGIFLQLNMPGGYQSMYSSGTKANTADGANPLLVNVSVFHNLDFTALAFPFYKQTSFNGVIPFYSIIKASNAPDMDSTVLIGNIVINGKVAITGICTPTYARAVVEKGIVEILRKEMDKIERDINRPPDTSHVISIEPPAPVKQIKKARR